MKIRLLTAALAAMAFVFAGQAPAAEDKDKGHDEKHHKDEGKEGEHHHEAIKGPNGGKVFELPEEVHAEFFVQNDRKIIVRFFDEDLKPLPVGERTATVFAQPDSGTVMLALSAQGESLVSEKPLPEGDGYGVMLRVQEKADGEKHSFKLNFQPEQCEECNLAEYACICDHDHDEHKHKEEEKKE